MQSVPLPVYVTVLQPVHWVVCAPHDALCGLTPRHGTDGLHGELTPRQSRLAHIASASSTVLPRKAKCQSSLSKHAQGEWEFSSR